MATRLSDIGEDSRMVSFLDIERMLIQSVGEISGVDMDGREYKGIEDLWNVELSNGPSASRGLDNDYSDKLLPYRSDLGEKQIIVDSPPLNDTDVGKKWYNTAYDFWEDEKNCPISDDGVLGGYGRITTEDVKGSNQFLDELSAIRPTLRFDCAADCGAGIGRVAKHLLLHRFDHVDIIEQSPRLLAAAPKYIGEMSSRATCVVQKLQDFKPLPNSYDVIWIQWVMGHLHDHDVIRFYQRCAKGLRPGGVIILKRCEDNVLLHVFDITISQKDNCSIDWTFVVDKEDNSVARCMEYIRLLIKLAGLEVVFETLQKNFPTELYPVTTFAIGKLNDTSLIQPKL